MAHFCMNSLSFMAHQLFSVCLWKYSLSVHLSLSSQMIFYYSLFIRVPVFVECFCVCFYDLFVCLSALAACQSVLPPSAVCLFASFLFYLSVSEGCLCLFKPLSFVSIFSVSAGCFSVCPCHLSVCLPVCQSVLEGCGWISFLTVCLSTYMSQTALVTQGSEQTHLILSSHVV